MIRPIARPVMRPIASAIANAIHRMTPADLFQDGTIGVWYDPSDFTTLYQDAAGTTPVTALEQSVGLMLDKSRGLAVGAEAFANTFDSVGVGWSYSNGTLTAAAASSGNSSYANVVTNNRRYIVTFTVTRTAGTLQFYQSGTLISSIIASGTYTYRSMGTGGNNRLQFTSSGFEGAITGISIKEIAGNHAYQTTSGARPVVTARVNQLLNTGFAGAVAGTPGTAPTSWTFPVSGGATAISGSTITLSATAARHFIGQSVTVNASQSYTATAKIGLVSGSILINQAMSIAGTAAGGTISYFVNGVAASATDALPAGENTISAVLTAAVGGGTFEVRLGVGVGGFPTASVTVRDPDLRLTIDANSRIPSYQRVTTATDYDSAGFPIRLRANGAGQFMQTAAIDWTGTDAVTAWVGVRKLSDAATAVVFESSAASDTIAGTFSMVAPSASGANSYRFASRGSASATAGTGVFAAAPNSSVLTGIADISADSCTLRRNGAQVESVSTDQGTGNYTSQPLYLFSRAGSSLWLNGSFSSLVIVGKACSAQQVQAIEAWTNQRTRAY